MNNCRNDHHTPASASDSMRTQGWIQLVSLGGNDSGTIWQSSLQVSFRIVQNHGEKCDFRKF